MITDRDRRIVRHFEVYKYATIEQIQKIFLRQQKNGYNIARRRLNAIKQAGYIKVDRDVETNRLMYMYNEPKIKMPDKHRIILLDVLANLHYSGFNVQLFEIEKEWQGGKIRSDGFTVFTLEGPKNRYHYFIEIQLSNHDYSLEKYDRLYETGEVQSYLGRNIYPRILLITDRRPQELKVNRSKVVVMNPMLDEFAAVSAP